MAVLGVGGRLEPALRSRSLRLECESLNADSNQFNRICDGYWSGDHVAVDCLPTPGDGEFPPSPSGYASYFGSRWFLGPNRTQITENNDTFYKTAAEEYPDGQAGDAAQFYAREGDTSGGEEI